jgi:hypothetical protein
MIFPVVAYKRKGKRLYVFPQEDKLKITSEELLYQDKIFDGIEFIDSEGNIFKILSVKKTGWGTPLFGYSLTRKGRLIKIDFELQMAGHVSIGEFRDLVMQSSDNYHPLVNEIKSSIEESHSYAEIINLVK